MASISSRNHDSQEYKVKDVHQEERNKLYQKVRARWGMRRNEPLILAGLGKDWLKEVYGINRVSWYSGEN